MKFYSTNDHQNIVDLKEAVLNSMPSDKGLYMPTEIPKLSSSFFQSLRGLSLQEIALEMATPFLKDDFSKAHIHEIIEQAIDFPAPLIHVEKNVHSLELWHGPTLAFKDFGARFMAAIMSRLVAQEDRELHILVATSGDTGGAVASGFLGVPYVKVCILYPSGKVSPLQEKQLTTLGQNIKAIEVDGSFDDCQALVKRAFLDPEMKSKLMMASANSINISRLIPQTFYYVNALAQLDLHIPTVISVPSGNFGNLTAGLLAKKMGLPVNRFIAATNANDIVPAYLKSGVYEPRHSVQTISNAMDVGNPSNFSRMMALYNGSHEAISKDVRGNAYTDEQTRETISEVHSRTGYVMDPHGAIAYMALKEDLNKDEQGVFLETAHPAKFLPTMNHIIGAIEIPNSLSSLADKEGTQVKCGLDFEQLKEEILSQN